MCWLGIRHGIHVFATCLGGEENYRQALDYYYAYGPVPNWEKRHISAYASAHPWEDWAETWAHYLHIMDTLETATGFGLIHRDAVDSSGFHLLMQEWRQLTRMMNALNRSMGQADAYPFTLSRQVIVKLRLIHQLVTGSEGM
ncbi:MAG: putative zinc-binding metallopeptidase [Candidatus Thiothrix putei]|uniref:Zinc-binding metallopeptidase n=1 Tax=Candidatus Thiothrix putei TaxID=3080811 RepID=A0AA95HG08_9GAMM|nr:MAG: putative zinc-binding metallopeptidase [Candidatus Thiothrix putei]